MSLLLQITETGKCVVTSHKSCSEFGGQHEDFKTLFWRSGSGSQLEGGGKALPWDRNGLYEEAINHLPVGSKSVPCYGFRDRRASVL